MVLPSDGPLPNRSLACAPVRLVQRGLREFINDLAPPLVCAKVSLCFWMIGSLGWHTISYYGSPLISIVMREVAEEFVYFCASIKKQTTRPQDWKNGVETVVPTSIYQPSVWFKHQSIPKHIKSISMPSHRVIVNLCQVSSHLTDWLSKASRVWFCFLGLPTPRLAHFWKRGKLQASKKFRSFVSPFFKPAEVPFVASKSQFLCKVNTNKSLDWAYICPTKKKLKVLKHALFVYIILYLFVMSHTFVGYIIL